MPGLAFCGVREVDFAAEDLSIQRGKAEGRVWVKQTEELQLVNVEVADGLHHGKLGHHLRGFKRAQKGGQKNVVATDS